MIKGLINLPFKVLGRVSRAVQDRQDAAMKARHGEGDTREDWQSNANIPAFDTPADYNPGPMTASAADLVRWFAAGDPPVVVVDVRPGDYVGPRMPGVEHIPYASLPLRLSELPPEGTRAVLVCADGKAALEATRFVRFRGNDDAWALQGGVAAWAALGKKVLS